MPTPTPTANDPYLERQMLARLRGWARIRTVRALHKRLGMTHRSEILRVLAEHGGEMKRVDLFRASPTLWLSVSTAIERQGGRWPISTGPEHALDKLCAQGLVVRTRWAHYKLASPERDEKER